MIDVIGLVPAAGLANRISPLPCSKEVFPLSQGPVNSSQEFRPAVAGSFLLRKLRNAGVRKAFLILRKGKWDIPQYFGDGTVVDMNLGYLIMGDPHGVPFTINQGYPFVEDKLVAFGFPDILYPEEQSYRQLLEYQARSEADVVLGLFPVGRRQIMADRVLSEQSGHILEIQLASNQLAMTHTWGLAVWTPCFSQFLHELIDQVRGEASQRSEWTMSEVINKGIQSGLKVHGITVSLQPFLDIGTPEGLAEAMFRYAG